MFVISTFHRYRLPLLLFILSLISAFLLRYLFSLNLNFIKLNSQTYQQVHIELNKNNLKVTNNAQKTILANGLTVLTKEVHNAPVVTVQMWYNIGSVKEYPGINGIAHQLEHIMFKGTKNRPVQFAQLFSALGSDSNAFTSFEQTVYYHRAEQDKLKALLELEADRMQNLLIDNQHLESEKRVVISELQGYENSPKYRLKSAVMRSLFPDHGYGLPPGGTVADVKKLTIEQVRDYYKKHYQPNNAILVIVGDFSSKTVLETVKDIFGKIPKSPQDTQLPNSPTPQVLPSPVVLREPGGGKFLQLIYPLPHLNHPDVPALGVTDYILTAGKNSYLYQALVESGLATDISAHVASLRGIGWYDLSVTVAPNQDLDKVNAVTKDAIAKVVKKGVTLQEVERAKNQLIANVILNRRDINSQGMQLGNDMLIANDYRYTEKYIENVRNVKPTDVVSVINKYFKPKAAAVGFFAPQEKIKQENSKDDNYQTSELSTSENLTDGVKMTPSQISKYLPATNKNTDHTTNYTTNYTNSHIPQRLTLVNGLQVLLLPDQSSPTVTINGYIKAGKEFEKAEKAGLASLVADNLLHGTKTKDTLTIADILDRRGASLDFTALREGVRIQGKSLQTDLRILLETIADVVKNSTFPEKELEISRQQAVNNLKLELDDADELANRKFMQALYPQNHPLYIFPTLESIHRITRKDVIAFREKHYRPDTMILVLVGDFEVENVRSLLETEFGNWRVQGKPPMVEYPQVVKREKGLQINSLSPGKSQTITYMGNLGVKRQDPRFYSALVLNQILAGNSVSGRLGSEVRDRLGLTYGIYSNFQGGKNAGTFLIEMQTSPEDTHQAIATTQKILKQIHQQGVTDEEVETAKRTVISNYNISLSKPEELTNNIMMNEIFGLNQLEIHKFSEKIQQVTKNEVNQFARQQLDPNKLVVVTVGPTMMADSKVR